MILFRIPAACLALKALSSSSSSTAFFFGFLLWMGFVPAGSACQLLHILYVAANTKIPP